ncbi:hypothetical protein KI387_024524, partial [Taxus chinensis]
VGGLLMPIAILILTQQEINRAPQGSSGQNPGRRGFFNHNWWPFPILKPKTNK